ncbi:serine/threonine protein kinase [Streptomyces sp. CB03234]|uniref:serine/threonine-protein kinase n=1 Tax=Streptomyces sp. (strain CB03234) TaxID=1703937 RepID=UPI00093ECFA1|nr:serine/threonine-protein kinase [Streptomyces sp. CB03234]OKK05863.1 serine/threonine protein kinase [Streptomyces sp. CB03234]
MQPLEVGDPGVIGPYRLLGRLGAGGMGRVYLARSEGGRTVAVKVVHPHFALDEEFRARFRREVESARRVGGDGVSPARGGSRAWGWTAPVLDADPDAPVPWVATGYVSGPPLAQAVTEHGPLPEHTVRALGAGLAEALAAVHALGLVHRDVKPSNVLLALDGPRLIDFGIARATDGTASLTSTGVSVGSPGYMAPEQILGKGVSGAADVFSLGAVLAYAATGAAPFPGGSSAALLYKVVHEEPELGGALTGELRDLVAACLAKDPAARPAPAELAGRLAPGGAAALVSGGWLPGPLVERVSRDAVRLLDLEPPAHPSASGPVPFSTPAVGASGGPVVSGVFGPPIDPVPTADAGPPPRKPVSLSVSTTSEPTATGRGRRLSCTVALAVAGALAAVTVGGGYLLGLFGTGRDHTDTASPKPTTSASGSAPEGAVPASGVPKEFLGTWKGPTREAQGVPHGDLTVVITRGRAGDDVMRLTTTLTVLTVTAECHAVGRLTSAEPGRLTVTDRSDPKRPGSPGMCTAGSATLTFTLNEDGTLHYQSDEAAAGRPSGTLTKQGG